MAESNDPILTWPMAACRVDGDGQTLVANDACKALIPDLEGGALADRLEEPGPLRPGAQWRAKVANVPGVMVVQAEVHASDDGWTLTFCDVTELHCRAEHLSDLFKQAPDAFVVADRSGTIRFANDQAAVMFKRPVAELIGTPLETLMPSRYREGHVAMRQGYAEDPHVRPMGEQRELFAVDAEGHEIPVEISLAPIGERHEGLFGAAVRDVTEARRQRHELERAFQRLERTNQDLEAFAGRAAHDLRAPLRHIRTFIQLLGRSDIADEGAREWLARVEQNTQRLDGLIDGLLQLSGLGTEEVAFDSVDLAAVCMEVLEDRVDEIDAADANIVVDQLPRAWGDERLLRSVLANLISNALRYRRDDEPLTVQITGTQDDGVCAITVKDNGTGIDAEVAERVFEPFERAHAGGDGHGIGLALCRRILEAHGGTIEAVPSDDGACIRFTLPAVQVAMEPPAH